VDLTDRTELHELPCRYGDMIDDRNWDGLSQIFLEDATFEIPGQVLRGLSEIRAFMNEVPEPPAHIMTNIYVDETPEEVTMRFRIVGLQRDGTVMSGRYRDVVVRGPDGWRVASRVYS
jgi:hypothetical protein